MSTDASACLRPRRLFWLLAAVLTVALAATALPGLAQSAGDDPVPSVVFLARADNPVDALAASSIAGALGGAVLLTPPGALSPVTRQALIDLDPDLVVLAGGTAALSAVVEQEIAAIPLATQRVSGPTRIDTAVELGALAAQLGIGRPLLTGATVAGDAGLSGTLSAGALDAASADVAGTLSVGALEVASDAQVANLNASLLGGLGSADFLRTGHVVVASGTGFVNTTSSSATGDVLTITTPTAGSLLIDMAFNCASFAGTTGTRWNVVPQVGEEVGPFFTLWFAHGASIVGDGMSESFAVAVPAGEHSVGFEASRALGDGSLDCDIRVSALFLPVPTANGAAASASPGQGSSR